MERPPVLVTNHCRFLVLALVAVVSVLAWADSARAEIYWVTTTADTGDGSLRWALACADTDAVLDSIYFNIPTSDPGYNPGPPARWVIRPDSSLIGTDIWDPVVIDGYTQPGAQQNTIPAPGALNAAIKIVVNGVDAGASTDGFVVRSQNSVIRGLAVNNWGGIGIHLANPGPCLVEGNYIGTHVSGTYALGNTRGVEVLYGQHTIGGTTPAARNLISGNTGRGIFLDGAAGNPVEQTLVQGNLIGTNAAGTAAVPNGSGSGAGVYIDEIDEVTIGGTLSGACNVISGNDGDGIYFRHESPWNLPTGLLVQGNYIGTTAAGNAALGNTGHGVHLYNGTAQPTTTDAVIGGTVAGAGNVISGNDQNGIYTELDGLTIQGNYIGTDAAGTADLGNGQHGVYSQYADSLMIGGASSGAGNLISGNDGSGIYLHSADYITVQGNHIGTDVTGSASIGNAAHGIYHNASSSPVGGTGAGEPNTIAFNGSDGLYLYAAYYNPILSNSIHSNGGLGIDLEPNGVNYNDYQDPDFGSNFRQNYPVLTSARTSASQTVLDGTLNSTPNTTFYLEFYHNTAKDPSNYGEGETWIDSTTVTTDGNGDASFSLALASIVPIDDFVCAAATDPDGNTSEFSANRKVTRLTLVVTNTNDSGAGSLRQAVLDANALAGPDSIVFDISTSDPGYVPGPPSYWSIQPASMIPALSDTVVLDGYTQTGAQENTGVWPAALDGVLKIELDGSNAGASGHGVRITGAGCTVRGLVINRFGGQGIRITSNGGNTIQGCYLGTDVTGTSDLGNGASGIQVFTGANTVGGSTPADRNLISGNASHGVALRYAAAANNLIRGNFIGVDATGVSPLGNDNRGVRLYQNPTNNTIGGTGAGAGNTIAYSGDDGVGIHSAAGNVVRGNWIFSNNGLGIDLADDGVTLNDSADVDTGPNDLQNFPVLTSVETGAGWTVVQGTLNSVPSSTFTVDFYSTSSPDPTSYGEGDVWLASTPVSTDANGDASFSKTITPEVPVGTYVTATATNAGGSTSEFSECVAATAAISPFVVTNTGDTGLGSLRYAIAAANDTAGVDTITFNIPTSDPGYVPGPPSYWSIQPASNLPAINGATVIDGYTQPGAQPNTVAAPDTSDAVLTIELRGDAGATGRAIQINNASNCVITGLVINRFPGHGLSLSGTGSGHRIEGNYIGTDITGTLDRGNTSRGIQIQGPDGNTVGGTSPAARNVIAGNNADGIFLYVSDDNMVQGNFIGTDVTGKVDRGNSDNGIYILDGANNTIGGTSAAARNIISGNGSVEAGITVRNPSASGNVIQGNYIGTDVTGTTTIANTPFGIQVYGAPNNTIGGSAPGAGNVICGSLMQGIMFFSNGTNGNVVHGNYIGTNEALATGLGNGLGIDFQNGSPNGNTVGGTAPGEGNIVWYNTGDGIRVLNGKRNAIIANSIYENDGLGIQLGSDAGVTPNDSADVDGGPNQTQNYPVLTGVVADAFRTIVQGSLNSMPDSTFTLQFYYNSTPDPTGYGEGETFFGDSSVTVDAAGDASFAFSFDGVTIPDGSYVTATAADQRGNTSEFCQAVVAVLMTLDGQVVGTALQLDWTAVPPASEYWVYGASNEAYFVPELVSPYAYRLTTLPSGTTTWSSSNGIGDVANNWTYMVIAVDASDQEITRSNRFGEHDFDLDNP
jgi:parallel beta-helix repeat protein